MCTGNEPGAKRGVSGANGRKIFAPCPPSANRFRFALDEFFCAWRIFFAKIEKFALRIRPAQRKTKDVAVLRSRPGRNPVRIAQNTPLR